MDYKEFSKQATAIANRYACFFFTPGFDHTVGSGIFFCLYRFPTDVYGRSPVAAEEPEEALRQLEATFRAAHQTNLITSIN